MDHRARSEGRQDQGLRLDKSRHQCQHSNKSNTPESYVIVPNKLELDQAVVRIERLPDTVQRDHVDWGFRFSPMYGIDYRWTTAQGWFSGQLLNHNRLYGFDLVEAYGLVYIPNVA